jgi:hypothetical protein
MPEYPHFLRPSIWGRRQLWWQFQLVVEYFLMSELTGASRNPGTESDQVSGNIPSTCRIHHSKEVAANVRATLGKSVFRWITVVKQRWAWLVLEWVTEFKTAQINGRRCNRLCGARPNVLYSTNTNLAVNILQDFIVREKPHQFLLWCLCVVSDIPFCLKSEPTLLIRCIVINVSLCLPYS